MNTFRQTELKLIGAFFLVAGAFGFVMFLQIIFPLNNLVSLINLFPTFLFGLTVYSGYLLIIKESPKGIELGRAAVALQIINFHIAGVGYTFVTGPYLLFGFVNLGVKASLGIASTFQLFVEDGTGDFIFRVNLIALAAFGYLTRVLNKISDDEEKREALEKSTVPDNVSDE